MVGEGLFSGPVEVEREPGDTAQHVHGGDVHVRTLSLPCGNQSIDIVFHTVILVVKILDVEISTCDRRPTSHALQGDDPVFDWVSGTGAAYPGRPAGTVFLFLRTFAVARRPA